MPGTRGRDQYIYFSIISQCRERHMGKHQGQSGGRGSEGKTWAGSFTVVSAGRNVQGRVSRLRRFRIGSFDYL